MESHVEHDIETPENMSRWSFLVSWPALFMAAFLIFEITSNASLGVVALCGKFGWARMSTAIWLRKYDPDKIRGKMEFWIYCGSALWNAAKLGFMLMPFFVLIGVLAGMAPNRGQMLEAASVGVLGFAASAVATGRALFLSLWHKRRIWLSPDVCFYRNLNSWSRPTPADHNQAGALIDVHAVGVVIFIMILVGSFLEAALTTVIICAIAMALIMGFALLFFRDHLDKEVLATIPEQCWGIDIPSSDQAES